MTLTLTLISLVLFHFSSRVASANGNTRTNNNNSIIGSTFPQLHPLQRSLASSPGSQDFDHCCRLAVNDSLSVINGSLVGFTSTQSFIADQFDAFRTEQFPCAATYNGNKKGAPPVSIPYAYCKNNCPGWQRSKSSKLNQWVSPFTGFLIPSVVFCLAIPRRRKIWIPDSLFDFEMNRVPSAFPRAIAAALAATVLVVLDTIAWVMTLFALSGPILLSAIYEAFLDNRLLEYVNDERHRLTIVQRARLLYIILIGNLDMYSGGDEEDVSNGPWNRIDGRTPEDECLLKDLKTDGPLEAVVDTSETRLRTMLASQYSFGVTVGAPIVFFCGSFIYTLIDNFSNLGDNDTSHALAFGMWWMAIPHIAIISGLLLAGNNPNTLEGVVGRKTAEPGPRKWLIFELVYESRYRPAWIWDRGRSKRIWAMRVQRTYHNRVSDPLRDRIAIKFGDWMTIGTFAFALIAIPSILAFLTSYYTPTIGLGCRSMTFLVYMLCQFCLILLWIWNIQSTTLSNRYEIYHPATRIPWTPDHNFINASNAWYPWVWWPLVIIAVACATFTAIGGTMMQIIGVYRTCLCMIPVTAWHRPDHSILVISTNSADAIYRAHTVWRVTGAAAVAFLGFVSFIGWWYQKRLRHLFKKIVATNDQGAENGHELVAMGHRANQEGHNTAGTHGNASKDHKHKAIKRLLSLAWSGDNT